MNSSILASLAWQPLVDHVELSRRIQLRLHLLHFHVKRFKLRLPPDWTSSKFQSYFRLVFSEVLALPRLVFQDTRA